MVKVKMFEKVQSGDAPAVDMPKLDRQAFYDVVQSLSLIHI